MNAFSDLPGVRPFKKQISVMLWATVAIAAVTLCSSNAYAQGVPPEALSEASYIRQTFGVPIKRYVRAPGAYTLSIRDSLTASMLSGKVIDNSPPYLSATPNYPAWQQDNTSTPAYIAPDIGNFGFKYFHNEFNLGGWNSWPTQDYASTHGFGVVSSYYRDPYQWWSSWSPGNGIPQQTWNAGSWLPAQTQWMGWVSNLDWHTFGQTLGVAGTMCGNYLCYNDIHWDALVDIGENAVKQAILASNLFQQFGVYGGALPFDPGKFSEFMIDLEHSALSPQQLRAKSWYPSSGTAEEKVAFEKKYYDGYAMSHYVPVKAARELGFRNISLYGWKPISANWYDLSGYVADPTTDWYWQFVGKQVIEHVDSVNNSVYNFYWTPENLAFTLAQNDLNIKFVNSLPASLRKPVRPYFWNQLHGGGGSSWNWWAGMPLASEEMRAMALLNAFTQYDGMVLWNWTGAGPTHSAPPPIPSASKVNGHFADGIVQMFKEDFTAVSEVDGIAVNFSRYDAIYITNVDADGNVQFQRIDKLGSSQNNYGVGAGFPFYRSTKSALTPHLRAASEPLAGLFEGLAMTKLLEWNLRHGTIVSDQDSQQVFALSQPPAVQIVPIIRHIANGDLHVVATYDPQVVYGKPARVIPVNNFGGVTGLNLTFPADSQVRVYMIRLTRKR
jgi:hypothetical protein